MNSANQNFSVCWTSQLIILADQVSCYQITHLPLIMNCIHFHLKLQKFINILNFTDKKPIKQKILKPTRNSLLILIVVHGRNVFILYFSKTL